MTVGNRRVTTSVLTWRKPYGAPVAVSGTYYSFRLAKRRAGVPTIVGTATVAPRSSGAITFRPVGKLGWSVL